MELFFDVGIISVDAIIVGNPRFQINCVLRESSYEIRNVKQYERTQKRSRIQTGTNQ